MTDPETLTCYKHPNRETMLRCNKCNQPICAECAVLTPTGYRCKECVRGQQKKFNTAKTGDLILAILLSGGLSFLGSLMPGFLRFFTIFAAPFAGTIIVEVINKVSRGRRSQSLSTVTIVMAVLGSLPLLIARLFQLWAGVQSGVFGLYGLLPLIWQAAYTFLMAGSVYYRMKGIRIG